MACCVGTTPKIALPARTYATACSAPARSTLHSLASHSHAASSSRSSIAARTSHTSRESSIVRPNPSPFQNGIDGGAPCASSTRTTPASTRRIRHEFVPSRKMSPAMLSIAKSSSSVPIACPSGSTITRVVGGVRDRAAARERREPRTAPRAQPAVDAVVVQERAAAPARRSRRRPRASRRPPRNLGESARDKDTPFASSRTARRPPTRAARRPRRSAARGCRAARSVS